MSGRGAHTKIISSHPIVVYDPHTWELYSLSWYNNKIHVSIWLMFQDYDSLYFIMTYAERGDFFSFLKKSINRGNIFFFSEIVLNRDEDPHWSYADPDPPNFVKAGSRTINHQIFKTSFNF